MEDRKTPWTEGPWRTDPELGDESVLGPAGVMVADCAIFHRERSAAVSRANARLIAKAPEMVEALERLTTTANLLHQNCVGCAIDHHSLDLAQQGLPGWLADAEREIAEARALLAEITGDEK